MAGKNVDNMLDDLESNIIKKKHKATIVLVELENKFVKTTNKVTNAAKTMYFLNPGVPKKRRKTQTPLKKKVLNHYIYNFVIFSIMVK